MVAKYLIVASLLLAGCQATIAPATGDWCDVNEPRRHTKEVIVVMSEKELNELIAHNRYGAERCGWRP